MNFIRDNMAPLMFAGMIAFMLIGYPAAFSLAATGLFFGFLGIEFGLIRPDSGTIINDPSRQSGCRKSQGISRYLLRHLP